MRRFGVETLSPLQGWVIGGGVPWALPRAMAVLAFQAEGGRIENRELRIVNAKAEW
jgi:hypothetical protein